MLGLAYLFFLAGFVTWTNGVLVPFFKTVCELTASQSLLVPAATYIAFVCAAWPSSQVMERLGFVNTMGLGLAIASAGSFVVVPAAHFRNFFLFLCAEFVQSIGMMMFQTAGNTCVTIMGPMETGAKRNAYMGIANKIAGAAAAAVFGAFILSGLDQVNKDIAGNISDVERAEILDTQSRTICTPYLWLAIILGCSSLALFSIDANRNRDASPSSSSSSSSSAPGTRRRWCKFWTLWTSDPSRTTRPNKDDEEMLISCDAAASSPSTPQPQNDEQDYDSPMSNQLTREQQGEQNNIDDDLSFDFFKEPPFVLGLVTLAMYMGVVVVAGDTVAAYALAVAVPDHTAKWFTSHCLMSMVVGYTAGVLLMPSVVSQVTALQISAVLGLAFSMAVVVTQGVVSVMFVSMLGIANALVWSTVWPLTLGAMSERQAKKAAAYLMLSKIGGAVLPQFYGMVVDSIMLTTEQMQELNGHMNSWQTAHNLVGVDEVSASRNLAQLWTARAHQLGYWVLLPPYVVIAFYAFYGYRVKEWSKTPKPLDQIFGKVPSPLSRRRPRGPTKSTWSGITRSGNRETMA